MITRFLDPPHDRLELVRRALGRAPRVVAHGVDVTVEAETVVLGGSVRSWYHKQVAQESVRNVDGITRILNRIRVIPR